MTVTAGSRVTIKEARVRLPQPFVETDDGAHVVFLAQRHLQRLPDLLLVQRRVHVIEAEGADEGIFGYALTSVMGPIVAEIFEGLHFGTICGTITVVLIGGGTTGPWIAGVIHDAAGSYRVAFLPIIGCCMVSTVAIWIAAPRNVRMVHSRVPRM
jgi:MFS family permease